MMWGDRRHGLHEGPEHLRLRPVGFIPLQRNEAMISEAKDGAQDQADVQDDEIDPLPAENSDDAAVPYDDAATGAGAGAGETVRKNAAEPRVRPRLSIV